VELLAPPDPAQAAALAAMLAEAADLEETYRADVHAAQRDLGLALRLRPRDASIAARFRRVAALVAPAARPAPAAPAPPPPEPPPPEPESATFAGDEQLVQTLTDRLRADPRDHATAMALAGALERLGRDLDLVALLSARLDEGDAAERREVGPLRRAAFLPLAAEASAEGRASEADLYTSMAEAGEE
jgi:hypothetical protein